MADLSQSQQAFLTRYAPYANLASQQLGLPSRVILAKLALETGWGEHYANNNLPGLKTGNADQNDGFGSAQTKTWEDYGGSGRTNIKDGFIKYPTPEQSIGGLVPWLSNSTYMNSLADRQGGGIFDADPKAEASAVAALGSSGFSTDRNASAGVNTILAKLPNLSSYGIAPSFDPSIVNLMNYVPYNGATGQANVSEGLGGFANNNYNSGTEFQPQGELLSREKGTGIQLPSPTLPQTGRPPGLLDSLSDAITSGLEGAGRTAADAAGKVGDALSGLLPSAPSAPAPGPYDFSPGGLAGAIGDANFGAGLSPYAPAPGPYDFAGGLAAGGNVPNGNFGAGITQPGSQVAGTIAPNEAPTLPPQQAAAVPFNGFDAKAYLAANQDVANSATYGNNPLQHYLDYGYAEGRTLDPEGHQIAKGIDLNQYLAQNVDVAQAGQNPLEHYLRYGAAEGRTLAPGSTGLTIGAPSAIGGLAPSSFAPTLGPTSGQSVTASPGIGDYDFSSAYLQANPDVAQAGMNPWEHFVRYGAKEGRALDTAGDKFDASRYLSQNADVLQAGLDPLMHYVQYGAAEGRAAPILGADGTARNIASLGLTPTISAGLTPFLQPQGTAPTIGAPGLSPLVGPETAPTLGAPQSAPTIGPDFASLIGPGAAVQATSPGVVSPYGFGQNVSQGVAPGSFGTGITPHQTVMPYGFSGGNFGAGLGAMPQTLGSPYGVSSAVSNMGMDLPGATGISDYSFGGDVSGYDVNQGGGAPAPQEAAAPSGFGDGGAVAARGSQLAQEAFFKSEREKQALMTANTNLFGQQITNIAPGNQTVYDYATGKATGGQAPSIQQTPFTPVNMGGVFAPLATAAFMPRFTF